ncbi:hypothetical protein ZEAMMB73_Zm00001d040550 [Zea mays]|uniref:Uncharacterized protein n=1 Tax=Zea mays TaxID=4577 RepID=A0A1D6MRA6_MAIZE|nr:hypothetical protein ZEAMMB73_Zm00001d040550 [Zea mays]
MEMNEERKVSLLGLADILSASIGGFSWAPLISKICKNKVEAEAWFTGLSALICRGQHGSQVQHIDGIRIAGLPFDGARESSLSGSSTFSSDSFENKLSSLARLAKMEVEYRCIQIIEIGLPMGKHIRMRDTPGV